MGGPGNEHAYTSYHNTLKKGYRKNLGGFFFSRLYRLNLHLVYLGNLAEILGVLRARENESGKSRAHPLHS
jgi:hypothetical protein